MASSHSSFPPSFFLSPFGSFPLADLWLATQGGAPLRESSAKIILSFLRERLANSFPSGIAEREERCPSGCYAPRRGGRDAKRTLACSAYADRRDATGGERSNSLREKRNPSVASLWSAYAEQGRDALLPYGNREAVSLPFGIATHPSFGLLRKPKGERNSQIVTREEGGMGSLGISGH